MVERTHLAILESIYETGTVSKAADKLCVTQSALSQSIRKLENIFSIKLWEKAGRNIRFTEAGDYLLSQAQRLLPQLEHIDNMLKKFSTGVKGILRIGMECHPCYTWLLQILSSYLVEWPEIEVDVRKQFTFKGIAALYQYEIDVLVSPDPIERKGIKFYPVFDYEQVLLVPFSHPLAGAKWVEPEQLSNETLITYPIEKDRLDIFKDFLSPAKILPKNHIHVEDTDILLQMVVAGRGLTALPKWFVDEVAEKIQVKTLSLGKTGVHQTLYLGIRDDKDYPEYLKSFFAMAGVSL